MSVTLVLSLLCLHGLIGAADVVLNHELSEHLPQQAGARWEELLHGIRELVFAVLFAGMAWWQWYGLLAWGIVALLALEFMVSLSDSLLEDRTRRLPALERSLHVVLFINFGAYGLALTLVLIDWLALSTALKPVNYGFLSWLLSLLSAGSLAWSVRDVRSFFHLSRQNLVTPAGAA